MVKRRRVGGGARGGGGFFLPTAFLWDFRKKKIAGISGQCSKNSCDFYTAEVCPRCDQSHTTTTVPGVSRS